MSHQHELSQISDEQPSEEALVVLENISLTLPIGRGTFEVLRKINLNLGARDFVCLIGTSGCGKTSLLRVIAGYTQPTQGTIYIAGRSLHKPNCDVGVVFQQPNLYPWLSVAQNVGFSAKMRGSSNKERQRLIQYHLKLVGLSTSAFKLPYQLSGGMKQRVAIARSLAANHKLILMDEPFSALDAFTRESMQINLYKIWLKTEKCVLFITHDVDEALLLSTRILVMHGNPGRIVTDMENHFSNQLSERSASELRSTAAFVKMREYLVSTIKADQPWTTTDHYPDYKLI